MMRGLVSLGPLLLVLVGMLSTHGQVAWSLAIKKRQAADDDSCVLSFVVPKENFKSSCNDNVKLQRRVNSVAMRTNIYSKQLTEFREKLDNEATATADRLSKLEASIKAETGVNMGKMSEQWQEMSKRVSFLEHRVDELQSTMAPPPEDLIQPLSMHFGPGGEETIVSGGHEMYSASPKVEKVSHDSSGNRLKKEISDLVKSLVQAEMAQLNADIKDFLKKEAYVDNTVLSLLMSPVYNKDDYGVAGMGLRDEPGVRDRKLIQDDAGELALNDEESTGDDVEGLLKSELKDIKSRRNKAEDSIVENIGEIIQNMSQPRSEANEPLFTTKETSSPSDAAAQTQLSYDELRVVNTTTALLLSDDLSDTNDTFSGDTPDLNATDYTDIDSGEEDFLVGSARIGHGKETDNGSPDSSNSESNEVEDTDEGLASRENGVPGWVRDGIDRQAEMEAHLKGQIRAMLYAPLKEMVSLVEKRASDLEEKIRQQRKRSEDSTLQVYTHVERLDRSAEAVQSRVDILSEDFRDAQSKLDRLLELETTVLTLKKNITSSAILLGNRNEAKEDFATVKDMDHQTKRVKKLERLMGVYQQSVGHYRNETKHEYRELKAAIEAGPKEMKQKLREVSNRIEVGLTQAVTSTNNTIFDELQKLNTRLEKVEDDTVIMRVDVERFTRRWEGKWKKCRNATDLLRGRHGNTMRLIERLDAGQSHLAKDINDTAKEVAGVKIDLRLNTEDGWIPIHFDYDATRTACFGQQYMRKTKYKNAPLVGVVLCSPERYKIFLGKSRYETFHNIGDGDGIGDDHCEFVGTRKGAPVNLSPLNTRFDTIKAFTRKKWGEEPFISYINMIKPSPQWYECGVSIP